MPGDDMSWSSDEGNYKNMMKRMQTQTSEKMQTYNAQKILGNIIAMGLLNKRKEKLQKNKQKFKRSSVILARKPNLKSVVPIKSQKDKRGNSFPTYFPKSKIEVQMDQAAPNMSIVKQKQLRSLKSAESTDMVESSLTPNKSQTKSSIKERA